MPPDIVLDDTVTESEMNYQRRKTANLGGGGVAHAAPDNLEDLIQGKNQATNRVVDALGQVDPDSDRIDEMTYTRIVKGASIDNLRTTGVTGNYFGFSGFGASLLAP